jgi:hypothetical protein
LDISYSNCGTITVDDEELGRDISHSNCATIIVDDEELGKDCVTDPNLVICLSIPITTCSSFIAKGDLSYGACATIAVDNEDPSASRVSAGAADPLPGLSAPKTFFDICPSSEDDEFLMPPDKPPAIMPLNLICKIWFDRLFIAKMTRAWAQDQYCQVVEVNDPLIHKHIPDVSLVARQLTPPILPR